MLCFITVLHSKLAYFVYHFKDNQGQTICLINGFYDWFDMIMEVRYKLSDVTYNFQWLKQTSISQALDSRWFQKLNNARFNILAPWSRTTQNYNLTKTVLFTSIDYLLLH